VVVVVVVSGAPGTIGGGLIGVGGVGAVVVSWDVVVIVCGGGPPQAANKARPLITPACRAKRLILCAFGV
jgi:hypothetical protein